MLGRWNGRNEVFTLSEDTGIVEEKLSLKKNDIFIAHTKCIHAGDGASKTDYTNFGTLVDPTSKQKKTVTDLSFYFHFTFDNFQKDATTRRAEVTK